MTDNSTEQKILQAAKKVFYQKGMAGTRMQAVADEAGINKALLHYYFRSKQKLFEGVFMTALADSFPVIYQVLGSNEPLFDKIRAFTVAYIDTISKDPYLPVFVISELQRDPDRLLKMLARKKKARKSIFHAQVEAAIKNGEIRAIDPSQLFVDMISLCVYPFVAKPLVMAFEGLSETRYKAFIKERKEHVPDLLINSIKV